MFLVLLKWRIDNISSNVSRLKSAVRITLEAIQGAKTGDIKLSSNSHIAISFALKKLTDQYGPTIIRAVALVESGLSEKESFSVNIETVVDSDMVIVPANCLAVQFAEYIKELIADYPNIEGKIEINGKNLFEEQNLNGRIKRKT